jgi:hypothetical protein
MRIERDFTTIQQRPIINGSINTEGILISPRRPYRPQSTSSLTAADTENAEEETIGSRLTQDSRRDILFLRELNVNDDDEVEYTYERIATLVSHRYKRKVTQRAVQYIINTEKATPKKERDVLELTFQTYQLGSVIWLVM